MDIEGIKPVWSWEWTCWRFLLAFTAGKGVSLNKKHAPFCFRSGSGLSLIIERVDYYISKVMEEMAEKRVTCLCPQWAKERAEEEFYVLLWELITYFAIFWTQGNELSIINIDKIWLTQKNLKLYINVENKSEHMTLEKHNECLTFNCTVMNMNLRVHRSEGIIFKCNEYVKTRKINQSWGRRQERTLSQQWKGTQDGFYWWCPLVIKDAV